VYGDDLDGMVDGGQWANLARMPGLQKGCNPSILAKCPLANTFKVEKPGKLCQYGKITSLIKTHTTILFE